MSQDVTFDTGNSYDWDVTTSVSSWVDGTWPNYGFIINTENIDIGGFDDRDGSYFYSRDINQSTRLVVVYK